MNKRYVQWLLVPVVGAIVGGLVAWYTVSELKMTLTSVLGVASFLYFLGYWDVRQDEDLSRMQIFAIFSAAVMTLLTAVAVWNVL